MTRTIASAVYPRGAHREIPEGPPGPRGSGPSLGSSLPSLVSSSDKALMSFSRAVRDSWICRSIALSPAPTFRREGGGRAGAAPAVPGARRQWGEGLGTRTCSASSSSRLRAPERSTCREACRSAARVWPESRLARRRSCSPALREALASYSG